MKIVKAQDMGEMKDSLIGRDAKVLLENAEQIIPELLCFVRGPCGTVWSRWWCPRIHRGMHGHISHATRRGRRVACLLTTRVQLFAASIGQGCGSKPASCLASVAIRLECDVTNMSHTTGRQEDRASREQST